MSEGAEREKVSKPEKEGFPSCLSTSNCSGRCVQKNIFLKNAKFMFFFEISTFSLLSLFVFFMHFIHSLKPPND